METALALPDETKFRADIQAINKFQQVVHANLISGQDFGVIPGTSKPTLLKPGAEKITKLLGLCDRYEILDRQEDWQRPFFRYLVKCQLQTASSGLIVSEGFGECNSMEGKYRYRWVWPRDLPETFDKESAVTKIINTRNGKVAQYRVDNDDIYTQVNTLVKMAKKRALVDAALSAGRLSNVFTQDIEDIEALKAEVPEDKPVAKLESVQPKTEDSELAKPPKPPVEFAITRQPEQIKTLNDMNRACFEDFSLQPADVLRELNVSSKSEITKTPWECYLELAVIHGAIAQAAK